MEQLPEDDNELMGECLKLMPHYQKCFLPSKIGKC